VSGLSFPPSKGKKKNASPRVFQSISAGERKRTPRPTAEEKKQAPGKTLLLIQSGRGRGAPPLRREARGTSVSSQRSRPGGRMKEASIPGRSRCQTYLQRERGPTKKGGNTSKKSVACGRGEDEMTPRLPSPFPRGKKKENGSLLILFPRFKRRVQRGKKDGRFLYSRREKDSFFQAKKRRF